MRAILFFYNLAFPFVLLALLPSFLFRMLKRGKYRHKFGQRFGIYSPRVRTKLSAGGWTWVHAVSVGEVLIALKFIRELKAQEPSVRVVLSTTTSTGFALASRQRCEWIEPIYNPIDFTWTVGRAIRLIRPRRLIMVEAEVWPNLTHQARRQGATLALINARLSRRSEKRYRLVRPLTRAVFGQLDLLCVQEPLDEARWLGLGVERKRIFCSGSIKFDDQAPAREAKDFRPSLQALGVADDAPILLAASTHAGEEVLLGEVFINLRKRFPRLFYLVVPRHAERGREVRDELARMGLKVALRQGDGPEVTNPDVLVANTTGELRDWFSVASVVFIGKSLTSKGGQNPAEALAAGKPVLFGPNMQNFATLAEQLVREKGAIRVSSEDELEKAAEELLRQPAFAEEIARRGAKCLEIHRGATERTAKALLAL